MVHFCLPPLSILAVNLIVAGCLFETSLKYVQRKCMKTKSLLINVRDLTISKNQAVNNFLIKPVIDQPLLIVA